MYISMYVCAEGRGAWIILFSEVTLFENNVSTILSPIVASTGQPRKINRSGTRDKYNVVHAGEARETRAANYP